MRTWATPADRALRAAPTLGDHATMDDAIVDQCSRGGWGQLRDQLFILQDARHIGDEVEQIGR